MASPRSSAIAARATSKTTSYALPESQSTASCWVAGIDVAVDADQVLVEPVDAGGRVVGDGLAPELGPEARDEVDAAHRRPRLAQRGDRGHELARAGRSA